MQESRCRTEESVVEERNQERESGQGRWLQRDELEVVMGLAKMVWR